MAAYWWHLGRVILCCRGRPVHCGMFSSLPGLCPERASCDKQSHLVAGWKLFLWGKQKSAPLNVTWALAFHGDIQLSQPPHIQCPRPGPLNSSCNSQPHRPRVTCTVSLLRHSPMDESAARVGEQPRCSITGFLSFCKGKGRSQDWMPHHSGFCWSVAECEKCVVTLSSSGWSHNYCPNFGKWKKDADNQLHGFMGAGKLEPSQACGPLTCAHFLTSMNVKSATKGKFETVSSHQIPVALHWNPALRVLFKYVGIGYCISPVSFRGAV